MEQPKYSQFYRRVLNRAHDRFVSDLEPDGILDAFIEEEFLASQIRDIQELQTTSMRNRSILSKVSQSGVKGYMLFKKFLQKSSQQHLVEHLEQIENNLAEETNKVKHTQGKSSKDLDRKPTDKELASISQAIGHGWELLAGALELSRPTVEIIKEDHKFSTGEQVYYMLMAWKQRNTDGATLRALFKELNNNTSVTVDWDDIKNKLGIESSQVIEREVLIRGERQEDMALERDKSYVSDDIEDVLVRKDKSHNDRIDVEDDYDIDGEMEWLDEQYSALQRSSSLKSIQDNVKLDTHELVEKKPTYIGNYKKDGRSIINREILTDTGKGTLQSNHDDLSIKEEVHEEEDEEEKKLMEKIRRLKVKDKQVEEELRRRERLKEEELERMRLERILQEKLRMKEERMRKLRQEEELLERSLHEKETSLREFDKEEHSERHDIHDSKSYRKWTESNSQSQTKLYDIEKQLMVLEKEKAKPLVYKPPVPKLTESSFEEWKIEIETMIQSGLYQEDILRQAVRNSLTGNMRKILLTISSKATTNEIVQKLESIYGNVRSAESVMEEFYMAKQKKDENVSTWGVRLESLIQIAIEKGHITYNEKDKMLRTRFWRQLYSDELKNATRMYHETIENFEELRRKVRMEENEMGLTKESSVHKKEEKKVTSEHQGVKDDQLSVMKDLLERMKRLERELANQKDQGKIGTEKARNDTRMEVDKSYRGFGGRWDRGRYYNNGRGYGTFRGRGFSQNRFGGDRGRAHDGYGGYNTVNDTRNIQQEDSGSNQTRKENTNDRGRGRGHLNH